MDWAWAMISESRILSLPDHGQFVVVKGNPSRNRSAHRPIFDPKIATESVVVVFLAAKENPSVSRSKRGDEQRVGRVVSVVSSS